MPTLLATAEFASAQAAFVGGRGYLAACTVGIPTIASRAAIIADLDAAAAGRPDPAGYSASVERTRGHFASLVGVTPDRVAIGSQASVAAALVAAALPEGSEVLIADGDFSSIVLPFVHSGRGLHVRSVPLSALAEEVAAGTALVAFSLVQSATGEVADADGIVTAAQRVGARTLCDATQAVGWMPVAASGFDALVCHAYKWLCAPRGVSFLTVSESLAKEMPPLYAGWYAGQDPWSSCYGHEVELASDATRFDVSPAWQAFVGAEPALAMFAALDPQELYAHATGLASRFRTGMRLPAPERASAIVTWSDPEGCDLARLTAAAIVASGRAGRARVAFHLFNDKSDVDLALAALGC